MSIIGNTTRLKEKKIRITWSEEEWDTLAQIVWKIRKNNPMDCLSNMVQKAMVNFPSDRRRSVKGPLLKPLVVRLRAMDENLLVAQEREGTLKAQIDQLTRERDGLQVKLATQPDQPSKEELLGSLLDHELIAMTDQLLDLLPPSEVLAKYPNEMLLAQVPLSEILSYLLEQVSSSAKGFLKDLMSERNLSLGNGIALALKENLKEVPRANLGTTYKKSEKVSTQTKKLKVAIVGLLPEQVHNVERALGNSIQFHFVDKNRKDGHLIPANQEYVFLMTRFVSHGMQEAIRSIIQNTSTKLIFHHGGITSLTEKLSQLAD